MTGRIVLIEDDPDIAALVTDVLTEVGHHVDVRADLAECAPDSDVQLVITDLIALRSYDARAARDWIARVRVVFPKATVIVSTAHAPAGASGPVALGADAVLTKPFDIGIFTQTVESLLGR